MGAVGKFFANFKVGKHIAKGKVIAKRKPKEAMKSAEEALAINLNTPAALNLLAEAAENADAMFIAIEALEILREFSPDSESNLKNLARIYEKVGNGPMFLACKQRISELRPGDLEAQAAVRAAAATASMQDNWVGKESYQDIMDADQAIEIEKDDRVARNIDDIRERTEAIEAQVAEGNDATDLLRKLGDLYIRGGRFEDAINTYNTIIEKMGTLDPAIDRSIEKANVGIFDRRIEEAGDDQATVEQLSQERFDYRLERAEDRVKNYPNDNQLRYDLALVYWEGQMIDQALEQFQVAQRNPQRRLVSIVYLGRCFHAKKQYDMAVEQFSKATEEMLVMDKDKMSAMYHFGLLFEEMGENEKAMDCFKQIYQANVNYRDVKERMDSFYSKPNEG